jgi:hypothetical protein
MVRETLTARVERLENTASHFASLPARVGAVERELAEFRAEVRIEFAAVRAEMRVGDETLRAEVRAGDEMLRSDLRAEIRQGDEETRRYMRVLYEDLVDRIKTMSEGIDDLRQRP